MAFGERLRKERERRRSTVEATARALKIPADVVVAIEAGDLERFAPIYRKGYVEAYARHLCFDPAQIGAMVGEVNQEEPPLQTLFKIPAPPRSSDRWLRAGSYVLASLLIGTLAWQLTHEAVRISQGAVGEGAARQQGAGDAQGAEARPGQAGHVNASIAAFEDLSRARTRPATGAGKTAWDALHEPAANVNDPALPAGEHRLQLVASGDSWVEIVDARGESLEMDLLRGGAQREYQGLAPFRLLFGRASAVNLYMDGAKVELSGFVSGDVLQMSLDAGFTRAPEPEPPIDNG